MKKFLLMCGRPNIHSGMLAMTLLMSLFLKERIELVLFIWVVYGVTSYVILQMQEHILGEIEEVIASWREEEEDK